MWPLGLKRSECKGTFFQIDSSALLLWKQKDLVYWLKRKIKVAIARMLKSRLRNGIPI